MGLEVCGKPSHPSPKAPSDVVSVLQTVASTERDGTTEDKDLHFLEIWKSPRSAEPRDNAM